jgi:hypothetical protein
MTCSTSPRERDGAVLRGREDDGVRGSSRARELDGDVADAVDRQADGELEFLNTARILPYTDQPSHVGQAVPAGARENIARSIWGCSSSRCPLMARSCHVIFA